MYINSPLRLIITTIISICLILYFFRWKNRLSHKKSPIVSRISVLDFIAIICLSISILDITILELHDSDYMLIDASYSMALNDYLPNRYERVKEWIKLSKWSNDATVIPFWAFPLPMSFDEYVASSTSQFQQLTWWSWSAPWDALARTIQRNPKNIILITDGWINSWLDLNWINSIYTWKIIVWVLKSNDTFLYQTWQKTQLVSMNLPYRQSVITWKNELHIISTQTQIQDLFKSWAWIMEKSISHMIRKIWLIVLLASIFWRIILFLNKKKVA